MDRQDLAKQIEEIFERLQALNIPMRPENAEIMAQTFGQLRYVYNALTAEETKEAEEADVRD